MSEPLNSDPNRSNDADTENEDPIIAKGKALIGVGFFIAAVICVSYFKAKNGFSFSSTSTLSDLGTLLSGTSGLLFTLAGIYFIIKTIRQTRSEMDLNRAEMLQTRNVMNRQLAETTFFSLLENHKDVRKGVTNDKFETEYSILKSKLSDYRLGVTVKVFRSFKETKYSPGYLYSKTLELNVVGSSIAHLSNFIKEKLNNELFFHQTLLVNLYPGEKFLIGMIKEYDLEDIPDNNGSYSLFYMQNIIYEPEMGYVPAIYFYSLFRRDPILENLEATQDNISILKDSTKFLIEIQGPNSKLSFIKWKCENNDHRVIDLGTLTFPNEEFDFSGLFTPNVLQALVRHVLYFDLRYYFEIDGNIIEVNQKLSIDRDNENIVTGIQRPPLESGPFMAVTIGHKIRVRLDSEEDYDPIF